MVQVLYKGIFDRLLSFSKLCLLPILAFEVIVENTIVVIVVIGRSHLSIQVDNLILAVL